MDPSTSKSESLPWLVLMMKAPEPGKVKTRLAADIGDGPAESIYRKMVETIVARVLSDPGRVWKPVIAYTPADKLEVIETWLRPLTGEGLRFVAQPEGDLGNRLEAIFSEGMGVGAPAVVAIGADCVQLTAADIHKCFDDLVSAPIVLGETLDGGYWTIGMSGPHLELLRDMPWSTPALAEQTRKRAHSLGLKIAEQPRYFDIDTKADLDRLSSDLRAEIGLDGKE